MSRTLEEGEIESGRSSMIAILIVGLLEEEMMILDHQYCLKERNQKLDLIQVEWLICDVSHEIMFVLRLKKKVISSASS